MDKELKEFDLRRVMQIILKNIWMIIIVPVACAVVGAFITIFLISPLYQSSSMLIVNSQNNPSAGAANGNITSEQLKTASELVSTYAIIITSDTVLDKVINNLDLKKYDGMENIDAEKLAKQISVLAANETQVMQISVENENESLAKAINAEIVKVAPNIIINAVKAGSVEIISPAKSNGKVSPSLSRNTLLCFAIGIIAALLIAFLKSMFDNTINSDEDITQYLEMPVLGIVPKVEN